MPFALEERGREGVKIVQGSAINPPALPQCAVLISRGV
jgi:hypothetical protein